jgi:hypothetical protein
LQLLLLLHVLQRGQVGLPAVFQEVQEMGMRLRSLLQQKQAMPVQCEIIIEAYCKHWSTNICSDDGLKVADECHELSSCKRCKHAIALEVVGHFHDRHCKLDQSRDL